MSTITWDGVDPDFANGLWQAIREAEQATGSKARIVSVVRTPEKQAQLYADFSGRTFQYKGTTYRPSGRFVGLAAKPPGFEGARGSNHTYGAAADLGAGPVLSWLHKNRDMIAEKYGIEFLKGKAFQNDPGHIQKVGAAGAGKTSMGPLTPGAPNPEKAGMMPGAPVAKEPDAGPAMREPDFNERQGGSKFRNTRFNEETGRGLYQTASGRYISFDRAGNTIYMGKAGPAVPTAADAGVGPAAEVPLPRVRPNGVPQPRMRPKADAGGRAPVADRREALIRLGAKSPVDISMAEVGQEAVDLLRPKLGRGRMGGNQYTQMSLDRPGFAPRVPGIFGGLFTKGR